MMEVKTATRRRHSTCRMIKRRHGQTRNPASGARFMFIAEASGIRSAVRSSVKLTLISARTLSLTVKELRT